MNIVACDYEHYAAPILAILNHAIVSSTALFDYKPRAPETMVEWFRAKAARQFPVLGAVADDGALMGFATYGTFRAWPAYKYTVEHSVYVDESHRRKGVARALMTRLIAVAEEQSYHVMVGGIDATNAPSIALHVELGFTLAGTIHHAGFKFGRWLDLVFYELRLRTPARPVDG
ncbi:MAG TPA: GNAT family N-acetyltransferase [Gammaproteobacteria bacterium]|nr:GNAT family N-acetyltransferase [Gammaproteobacteria bacterium]